MNRLGLLSILFAAACGGGSSSTDAGPADAAIDPVDPDASLCDDGGDGLCADPATCPSDPDCVTIDAPPGCTPAALPPEPTDLLAGVSGLYVVRDVAADGDTVVFSAIGGGQPISSAKVLRCPATGCPATPATVGAIGGDPNDGLLAAFGGKVFWARKSPNNIATSDPINQVVRADLDGSHVEALVTGDETLAYATRISRATAVFEDYALVFDVSEASSSGTGPRAGIRAATVDLLSPPLPNVRTPRYTTSAVTGDDTYFAYWVDPITGASAPYDRALHIYDLDGVQVGSPSMTFDTVTRMQLAGTTLLLRGSVGSQYGLYACTLPACADLHEVGAAVSYRGFDVQVRDGRAYFASVEDQGCGLGLTGVLASCDVASLVAGTCTRRLHSTSFHWVNLSRLEIEDGVAYGISKTNTQAVFEATL